MKILLNGGALNEIRPIVETYPHYRKYLGLMWTPHVGNSIYFMKQFGMPIAMDNAAFSNFCETKYLSMIYKAQMSLCQIDWVSVPDSVGDAKATHTLFEQWQPRLQGIPLAYVAQDGCEGLDIPFDDVQCVFIGGTTDWKLSESAVSVIRESQRQNKIIHMGRVNSDKRLKYAYELGCHSVDGTRYMRFSKIELLKAVHFLDGLHRQMTTEATHEK